jgi:DNA helicase-2/ATP-dependent DNA helicase PcrA
MKKVFEENLNPRQLEAVKHIDGPLLVVAGAGSGKTRVITYRMAYLIDQGVPPSSILGLTFTNKAADEMKERVRSMLYPPPLVCTFHSFGARMLRDEIHRLGYTSRFVIYDEDDSLRAIKEAMKSLKLEKDFLSPKEIQVAISRQKNEVALDRSLPMRKSSHETQLRAVSEAYHSLLKQNNAVDFDDLILLPLRVFEDHPRVLRGYQDRYRYVLVDEYQDTNSPQYRLVKMLCRQHKNLCAVGDPDQSIYRWRGSDIRNILNFEKDFPGTRKIVLEQNYRSTTLILDAANSLIRHNSERTTKNLWSQLGEGEDIYYLHTDDHEEEARTVLEIVQHLVENNKLRYRDIAVFYRTHAQSRIIEEYLLAENVPYTVVGGPGFYRRMEIKDILAYLRVIASPEETISLQRIINCPPRRIGTRTLGTLAAASQQKGVSLYETVRAAESLTDLSSSARKALSSFAQIIEEFREKAKGIPPDELTEELISRIGYREMLEKSFPEDAEDRIDNLRELMDSMGSFLEDNPESGLDEFLERTSLASDIDAWEDTENRVSLMTVHNSKGLEFEAVIIVGLEEGIFPHANSLEDPAKLEEERRLCYVGTTRAKRFLYVTAAETRFRHGLYVENEESRFLSEMFAGEEGPQETNFGTEQETGRQRLMPRRKRSRIEFRPGDRVIHPGLGTGKVVGIEEGGSEPFVRVLFDGDSEARLLSPTFAELRKV